MFKQIKKTYFARALLRGVGQSSQFEINKGIFWAGVGVGGMMYSTLLVIFFLLLTNFRSMTLAILTLSALIIVSLIIIQRASGYVNRYWQGKEGEKMTRDEIEPLIAQGYKIFNDIPGKKFNIDFILVGPSGIYVIEVKNPRKARGTDKITSDGKEVYLNGSLFKRKNPIEQARRSANWLNEQFRHVDGHTVPAIKPVVLFPGFLVNEHSNDFWLMNPKRFVSYYIPKAPKVLTQAEVDKFAGMLRMYISQNDTYKDEDAE